MARAFAEIAFSPSVRAHQTKMGSAKAYANFLAEDADRGDLVGPNEAAFIDERDGFYQATVSEKNWPYVQFRGGPKGFLKVLSPNRIAYADFRGNRQYISAGNVVDNDRISIILMDYPNRRRLKIWGRAKLVDIEDAPELVEELHDDTYRGRPERAVVIDIEALDWNCPQHIPVRLTAEEMQPYLTDLHEEIDALQAENERLITTLSKLDK